MLIWVLLVDIFMILMVLRFVDMNVSFVIYLGRLCLDKKKLRELDI